MKKREKRRKRQESVEIFRSGELEIKETLLVVVLNSANCTVLTVQITLAKLGLTKLHLNPSGVGGSGA